MNAERDEMNKFLKELVIPELRKLNFKGSLPHFRKTLDGKTNLLTFQFDRNGGGFVIEIANYYESEFTTSWGKNIPLNKLTAHDLSSFKRKRIYPKDIENEDGQKSWFRYDSNNVFSFGNKYQKLAKKVVDRIPAMTDYWNEENKE